MAMDFFQLPEKESVPIYCFDHDLSKRGRSRTFYGNDANILTEATLDITLFPAFEKISWFNKRVFFDSIKEHLNSFYGIIHELFAQVGLPADAVETQRRVSLNKFANSAQ